MRLLSLSLRGAVGIERGLGLDQVEVDFTAFDPGIVAFVAPNGSGKTTVLENLHPFRCLVSRPGALQNHFYLRDSHRILKFEMGGHDYECRLLIDAQTGKQESYLYRDGEPLTDGKTTTYDAAVARLFGSEDLFFRSLFRAQGAESIAELKASERKRLFVELLGLSKYEEYHTIAKGKAAELLTTIEKERSRRSVLEEQASQLEDLQREIERLTTESTAATGELGYHDGRIAELEAELRSLEGTHAGYAALRDRLAELRRSRQRAQEDLARAIDDRSSTLTAYQNTLQEIEAAEKRYEKILQNRTTILEKVELLRRSKDELLAFDAKRGELDVIQHRISQVDTEIQHATSAEEIAIRDTSGRIRMEQERMQSALREREREVSRVRGDIAKAQEAASLIQGVPCSSHPEMQSTCLLLESARASRENLEGLQALLGSLEADEVGKPFEERIAELEQLAAARAAAHHSTLEALKKKQERLGTERSILAYDEAQHRALRAGVEQLERERWNEIASELSTADALMAEAAKRRDALERQHRDSVTAIGARIDELEARISTDDAAMETLQHELSGEITLQERIGQTRVSLADARQHASALRESISELGRRIAGLEAKRGLAAEAHAEIGELDAALEDTLSAHEHWQLLARATGRDGIQALELDVAGPNVSAIANQLLSDAFGSQFQISFETTRQSADGKRQIESFEIRVYSDGAEQTIEALSGGQRVWIEAALSQAIAIYLRRAGGHDLRTTFLDEADGALDSSNAFRYLGMLRASHELSGTHHTFLITHRQELLAHIPQQLHLVPGEGIRGVT